MFLGFSGFGLFYILHHETLYFISLAVTEDRNYTFDVRSLNKHVIRTACDIG